MMRCPDCSTRHNGSHVCTMDNVETRETTLGKRVKRVGERPRVREEALTPDPEVTLDDIFRMAQDMRSSTGQAEEAIPDGGPRSVLNDPPKPGAGVIGLTRDQVRDALEPPQVTGEGVETVLQHLRRLGVKYRISKHRDTGRPWVVFALDQVVETEGEQKVGPTFPTEEHNSQRQLADGRSLKKSVE